MKVLITGASSGIGKAIYEHLKQQGHEVHGLSRRGPDYFIDLSKYVHNEVPFFGYDLLVYAAGIMPLVESDFEAKIMQVNFTAYTQLVTDMLPTMNKGASIIAISSVSAYRVDPHQSYYAASKSAMLAWNKSMALRFAGKIRINAISPGFIATNLVPGTTPQELIDSIPMNYEAQPRVLLPAVDMLINSEYMTGQDIVIDGGVSL